ncbi:MAG: nuclear transport factor 2 family protein [Kineosporiaceae bacterium]
MSVSGVAVAGAAAATPGSGEERQAAGPQRCSTVDEERNLATFQEYLDTLLSGDGEAAQAFFSEDAVVEVHGSVPMAGTYSVQDGSYGEVMAQYWQAPTGDAAPAEPELWADCDQVILRGPFERTATTGVEVDTTVIEYFTFDDSGLMVRDDFYFTDTVVVAEALAG